MRSLVDKYAAKLVAQGLADPGAPLLAGLDAHVSWNREDPKIPMLEEVLEGLNINSLLYCVPASPYREMIDYLARRSDGTIFPRDSETRTFLHDLPVAPRGGASDIIRNLRRRRCVVLPGGAVATFGTVSPEEAFITFSSVCFAAYVKFMSDLFHPSCPPIDTETFDIVELAVSLMDRPPPWAPSLMGAPLSTEEDVYRAIEQAGLVTVQHRLVDSHFGNISMAHEDTLYISQTGASLDELSGCIDPCPFDGSRSTGVTASSELSAHMRIMETTGARTILHGHPRFCVIMSLLCDRVDCDNEGFCHLRCDKERSVAGIPIVPGEVGTGRYGLCNTVPQAMKGNRGVIVFGHGLFTTGKSDFGDPVQRLFDIERSCIDAFLERLAGI